MNIVGKLNVTVIECMGLKDEAFIGKMSPYVELRVGDEQFKTLTAQHQGTNPKFNASFQFNLDGRDPEIHFLALASEIGPDPKIARLDIPIQTLVATSQPTWYELWSTTSNKKQGQILLKCYIEGQQPLQQPFQQPLQQPFQQPFQQPLQQPSQQPLQQPLQQQVHIPFQHIQGIGQQPFQQQQQQPYGQPIQGVGQPIQPIQGVGQSIQPIQPIQPTQGVGQPIQPMEGVGQPIVHHHHKHQFQQQSMTKALTCVIRGQPGIVVSLRSFHGRYLCADSDHRVIGDRSSCGEWECWFMQGSSNQVSLRSAHGRYLHVDYAGRVFMEHSSPMYFMMQILSETTIALRSLANKYLCAESDFSLVCNRDSIGNCEIFTVEFPLRGQLSILGHHGNFLCCESNGTVVATRSVAKESELWIPMAVGVNQYAFQSYLGKFLRVDSYSGNLIADRDDMRDAEVFRLGLGQKPGTIAFRTSSSNKFLCFEDTGRVIANRDAVGHWECFTFLMS